MTRARHRGQPSLCLGTYPHWLRMRSGGETSSRLIVPPPESYTDFSHSLSCRILITRILIANYASDDLRCGGRGEREEDEEKDEEECEDTPAGRLTQSLLMQTTPQRVSASSRRRQDSRECRCVCVYLSVKVLALMEKSIFYFNISMVVQNQELCRPLCLCEYVPTF